MRVVISALLLILALHFLLESVSFRGYLDLSPKEGFDNPEDESDETKPKGSKNTKSKKGKPIASFDGVEADDDDVPQKLSELNEMKDRMMDENVPTKEGFCDRFQSTQYRKKQELVDHINCREPKVQGYNLYPFNENDANFGSDVMNLNRFYRKNVDSEPTDNQIATTNRDRVSKSMLPPRPEVNAQMSPTGQTIPAEVALEKTGVSYSLQPNTWRYYNELPMNGGQILPGLTGYDSLADQYSVFSNASPVNGCDPPERGANVNDDLRMGLGVLNSGRRGRT